MLRNRSHLGRQHGSQCLQVVFACLDELHEQPRRTTRLEEFHELSRRTAMPRLPFFREKHRAGCALTTAICRSYRPARCCGNDVIEHPKLHYSYLWQGVPLLDVCTKDLVTFICTPTLSFYVAVRQVGGADGHNSFPLGHPGCPTMP